MAWETRRGGRRYYYRSRRVGGQVRKECVGPGKLGEIAAWCDEREREERAYRAHCERTAQAEDDALLTLVNDFDRAVGAVMAAELAAAGFHRHKRSEWRRRRGQGHGHGTGGDGDDDQRPAGGGEHGRG